METISECAGGAPYYEVGAPFDEEGISAWAPADHVWSMSDDFTSRKREIEGWQDAFLGSPVATGQSRMARRLYVGMQTLHDSVDIDPDKRHGIPVLKGTRFKVAQVLAQITDGDSVDSLSRELRLNRQTIVDFLHGLAILINRPMLP